MKILIVGLGSIGQRHLRNILLIDKTIEIYAYRRTFKTPTLSNNNNVLSKKLNEKYKIKYVNTLSNLKEFKINAAIICTPSSFHIKEAIILAKQNISLFIEKPLSSSLTGINTLKSILKKNNKITAMVGYQLKFCPIINKLRKIIKSEIYGKPKYLYVHHGEHIKNFHKYEKYENLYAAKKKLGGGVALTQIHEIDYLLYVLENYILNKIVFLSGKITNLNLDVEDTVSSNLLFKKQNQTVFCGLHLNYYEIQRRREINIIFENIKICADLVKQNIKIFHKNKTKIHNFKYNRNDLFIKEMKYFLKKIKFKKSVDQIYSINNAIKSLKLAVKFNSKLV